MTITELRALHYQYRTAATHETPGLRDEDRDIVLSHLDWIGITLARAERNAQ